MIEPPLEDGLDYASVLPMAVDQNNLSNPYEDGDLGFEPLNFQLPDQPSSVPSFLSTPPRSRQLFSSSQLEFQTPSPPKGGLPDLPEPPSADVTVNEVSPQFNTVHIDPVGKLRDGRGDVLTLKTPRPPGGWVATPGTSFFQPNRDDSNQAYINSSDDGLLKTRTRSRSALPRTPAAPGGWAFTPATVRRRSQSDPKATSNEGGLATPVNPVGWANTLPPKTPAPPGGWLSTPGVAASSRKSILKVRFEPDVTSSVNESSDIQSDSSVYPTNGFSALDWERPTTPEPVMPVTPPSRSPEKRKRSPGVRVVDAYGNEQKRHPRQESPSPTLSAPRSKNGIRIVDALGREMKGERIEDIQENGLAENIPMTRVEALQRVRQGIQELAEGIESLDWFVLIVSIEYHYSYFCSPSQSRDDALRIQELDKTSRALKQSREQLTHDMQKAEKQLRREVRRKVRVQMFSRILSDPCIQVRAGNILNRNGFFLLCVVLAQIFLAFMMYRYDLVLLGSHYI